MATKTQNDTKRKRGNEQGRRKPGRRPCSAFSAFFRVFLCFLWLFSLRGLLLEIGGPLLRVDLAVLVGVDFVKLVGVRRPLELLARQPAVGVAVEGVELRGG